jgi:hypothetical protein
MSMRKFIKKDHENCTVEEIWKMWGPKSKMGPKLLSKTVYR